MTIHVPQLGESIIEATVGQWHKKVGDVIDIGDVLVDLETDKVDIEVGAEMAGILTDITRQEGEDVQVGDILGVIEANGDADTSAEDAPATTAVSSPNETPPPAPTASATERITPVAKRMADAAGVDISQVTGSGPGGRITKQDVQTHQTESTPAPTSLSPTLATPVAGSPPPIVINGRKEGEERIRMSRRRRTIAQRLVNAQQTAAMLTTFNEIDMSAVMDLRKKRQEAFVKRYDIKVGFTSFFVKATVGALKAFPRLNAEIQEDEMVLKHFYDIGIAVGAEEGLVVPVLRDADRQSFAEIEHNVKSFAQKSRDGSLTLEDLVGGTFTITNGGIFGSMLSTPIINPPQVGILGLHNIKERPVVIAGEIVIRPIMYVALTYDHRIVDGREAVQFLVRVKELIEDPESLLLEG